MKKTLGLLLLACLMILSAAALADEAPDITQAAVIKASSTDKRYKTYAHTCAFDQDYTTQWRSAKERRANLEVESPSPVYGLYLCSGTALIMRR